MGSAGRNFKKQFQVKKFLLEHKTPTNFCECCWQKGRSALPLLCVDIILFLVALASLLFSMIATGRQMNFGYWFIYLTDWGILFNAITTGFGLIVSYKAYKEGPPDATFGLPWYVKVYWALYNIAIPLALFITIYYWALLATAESDFLPDIDPVLDVFIHAINSVVMLLLLICSRHPCYILHFYFPVLVGLVYILFTLIYYYAGGEDPFGNAYIYPTLDWSVPGQTMVMVVISAVALIAVHLIVVALSGLRNFITRRFRRDSRSLTIS